MAKKQQVHVVRNTGRTTLIEKPLDADRQGDATRAAGYLVRALLVPLAGVNRQILSPRSFFTFSLHLRDSL